MLMVSDNKSESLTHKFFNLMQNEGFQPALWKAFGWVRSKLVVDPQYKRRLELSKALNDMLNATVAYGPFRGLKLSTETWWGGSADRAAMLLGLYEQEILIALASIPRGYDIFIDVGAANGYYAVGVLINRIFEKSYCFETSVKGRETISNTAKSNNVEERIVIKGEAKNLFWADIPGFELGRAALLVDIEGGEFALFDENLFRAFREFIIFIELHEWFVENGDAKVLRLKELAKYTHSITEFTTSSRDLSQIDELRNFSDTDRWLICSEGRHRLMTWLRLDPL